MAKDLKKIAGDCLAFNKHFEKVYVTSDGIPFQHKNDAVNYAVKLEEKEIQVFERQAALNEDPATTATAKTYALNAKDTMKLIQEAESIDAVMLLLKDDERATVKATGEKQVAILKQQALDKQAADADAANALRNAANPKDTEDTEGLGDGMMDHVITQEDLAANSDLVAEGINVGDTVQIAKKAE